MIRWSGETTSALCTWCILHSPLWPVWRKAEQLIVLLCASKPELLTHYTVIYCMSSKLTQFWMNALMWIDSHCSSDQLSVSMKQTQSHTETLTQCTERNKTAQISEHTRPRPRFRLENILHYSKKLIQLRWHKFVYQRQSRVMWLL